MNRRFLTAAACVAAATLGCAGPSTPSGDTTTHSPLGQSVAQLQVAPEHTTGYDRDQFGDYDRDAALAYNFDLHPDCDGYYSRYTRDCHALAEHGGSKERADDDLDIDHRVALGEAWASGAHNWTENRRDEFASDPANLIVMTASANRSKGQADPAEWMPPNAECHYAAAYVETKLAYGLAADREEKQTLESLATRC